MVDTIEKLPSIGQIGQKRGQCVTNGAQVGVAKSGSVFGTLYVQVLLAVAQAVSLGVSGNMATGL